MDGVIGLIVAFVGVTLGGVLKGATGAGGPLIGVPVVAMVYDLPTAVAVYSVVNLASNIGQSWSYRHARLPAAFLARFALAGVLGIVAGTAMLANLPAPAMLLLTAGAVFYYIGFRLMRPDWTLGYAAALRYSIPAGGVSGLLLGATGISAPVSVSYLNAMRLERETFIASISLFFLVVGATQLPALWVAGILTWERAAMGLAALAVMAAGMPLGSWLAGRLSRETFDKVILVVLAVIALRLVWQALA